MRDHVDPGPLVSGVRPRHLAHPGLPASEKSDSRANRLRSSTGHRRAAMEHVGRVAEQRARRADDGDLVIGESAGFDHRRRHRLAIADRAGNDPGGAVGLGDVRQQDERGELRPAAVGAGHDHVVVAVVAVVGLVVVDGAAVLGPELDLVHLEIGGSAEPLGRVDEIRVHGEPVERPATRTVRRSGRRTDWPRDGGTTRDRRSTARGADRSRTVPRERHRPRRDRGSPP